MSINSINDIYVALEENGYGTRLPVEIQDEIEQYILTELNKPDNDDFLADLNGYEQNAIKKGVPSLCYEMLERDSFSLDFVCKLLPFFDQKTLNQEGGEVVRLSGHNVDTPLAMAIKGLREGYRPAAEFCNRVVNYLIDQRQVNVDRGFVEFGHPLVFHCLFHAYQSYGALREVYYPLAQNLIDKSNHADAPSKGFGLTCVHLAAARNDVALLAKLLSKNPDLSIQGRGGIFEGVNKSALLAATELGRKESIQMLLDAGASPNQMPTKPNIHVFREAKLLSPYQTAVEMKADDIVAMFKAWSQQTGERLREELDPQEEQRRAALGIFQPKGDATFGKQMQMMHFKDEAHTLDRIKQAYGLSCYVEDEVDRANVECVLNTLLGAHAEQSNPAFVYFEPVRQRFLEECRTNSSFSLFVETAKFDISLGCFNRDTKNDIYVKGGRDYGMTVSIIAHEIGHFFGFVQPDSDITMVPRDFMAAFEKDRALWATKEPHPRLKYLIDSVDDKRSSYHGALQKNTEYFTRACVQFPMDLGIEHPGMPQEEFDGILEASMPNMWAYFRSKFMMTAEAGMEASVATI